MQIRPALQHASPTAAGFEPDIEDVLLLAQLVLRKLRPRIVHAEQLIRLFGEPDIASSVAHTAGHGADRFRREEYFALLVVKDRNRHAPGPLPRDAPVGAGFEHAENAVAPPLRDKCDGVFAVGPRQFAQRALWSPLPVL